MKKLLNIVTAATVFALTLLVFEITVNAATFIEYDGCIWTDNINDDAVYMEDVYGVYQVINEYDTFVGCDCFYGNVYFNSNAGYYAHNGSDSYISLGWDFVICPV